MEELIENTMDLMAEENPNIEQIVENLKILQENDCFSDLSRIRLIFLEIASELENEKIDALLDKYTNNNYHYYSDFLRNNDFSILNFTYKIAETDALSFYLTAKEVDRKYNSKQYQVFKKNQDFLKNYPVEEFGHLYLNCYFKNFDGLTEKEMAFCEEFEDIAEIHKREYQNQCRKEFMEMAKEKFEHYFDNKGRDILDQTFIRMYRHENQAIVKPRKENSFKVSGKPGIEDGTWASTSPVDKSYISKWDEWQKHEMGIDYKFVATFTINKDCKLLSVDNVNELAILYFLYPKQPLEFDKMLDLFNCADGKCKYSFASYQIDWDKLFEDYNIYHYANKPSIGEGWEMSNPYDAETILVRDVTLMENVKEYNINEYIRMFCIEDIER